jgi:hypothetical protein
MQSISWEAIRGVWSPKDKMTKAVTNPVDKLWQGCQSGALTQQRVQQAIPGANGERIRPPRWSGTWKP